MAVITEDAVRELAGLRGDQAPITSCYLDVDGRRFLRRQDVEHAVDGMLREARQRANGHRSVHDDLARIEAWVRSDLDRSRARGVAIFSCAAQDLWQVVELPVAVRPQVVINHAPAVGQLEAVLLEHEPIGVLLADRQRARLFVFELGELVEHTELIDELPRDLDVRGERERGTPDHHVEELAHQHLRHAARAAFDLFQRHPFRHLVVGAPDHIANELESDLHPYLSERLCGRVHVPVTAALDQVRAAAEECEHDVERRRSAALVDQLRAGEHNGRSVLGLPGVLAALAERRAERLVVSKGYSVEGWRCADTGALHAVGPNDPLTGAPLERLEDVVEAALEEALTQGIALTIADGDADLDVQGRIGALLRW